MEDRGFKNKKKLMDAALDEFSDHNYRQASLNRIIKKAKVSKGLFYFHFKDKKSLYLYLFEEVGKVKIKFFDDNSVEHKNIVIKDIFDLIKLQARLEMKFSVKHPKYYRLWLRFWKEEDKTIQEMVIKEFKNEIDDAIRPLIRKSIKKGELRSDFDEDSIIGIISHFLINFSYIFPVDSKKVEDGSYLKDIDKYMDFLKNGLLKR